MKEVFPIKLLVGCVFVVLFGESLSAQNSMHGFLGAARQDPRMQVYADQINYLKERPYRLGPVRELELRLQNRELYAGAHEYAIRLRPANPWEIRNTSRYFKSYQASLNLEQELVLKEVLAKRYELVLEYMLLFHQHQLKARQLEIVDKQLAVLEMQSQSSFFKEDNYVELSLEQFEEQTDLETLTFDLARKKAEINSLYSLDDSDLANWTYALVLSPDRVEQVVDSLMQLPLSATRLAYRKGRIALADKEYALERSNINPGFFQSEYMPYRQTRNPYGFSLGVTVPIFNPNRGDMAEKKLEILEATSDLALEEVKAREEVDQLYASLKSSLQRYRKMEQHLSNSRLEEMSETVGVLNQNNPFLRLKIDYRQLKSQRLRVQLLHEIYQNYVLFLNASDFLIQRPLTNYLSPYLQPL